MLDLFLNLFLFRGLFLLGFLLFLFFLLLLFFLLFLLLFLLGLRLLFLLLFGLQLKRILLRFKIRGFHFGLHLLFLRLGDVHLDFLNNRMFVCILDLVQLLKCLWLLEFCHPARVATFAIGCRLRARHLSDQWALDFMLVSADLGFNFGADRLPNNILRSLPSPCGNNLLLLFFFVILLRLFSIGEILQHFLIVPDILLDNLHKSLLQQWIVLLDPLGQLEDLAYLSCEGFVALVVEQLYHHLIDLFQKGGGLHHC